MRTKLKKFIALVLTMALCLSMFFGCALVRLDTDAVEATPFVSIEPHTFVLKNGDNWTSEKVVVTRKQARDYFAANSGQFLGQYPLAEIYKAFADVLYNNAIMSIYTQKQIQEDEANDLTQKQMNDLWKRIYDEIDTRIFTETKDLATLFGEAPPIKIEVGDGKTEPKYAVKKVVEESNSDEIIETPWRAATVVMPTGEKEKKEVNRTLQATRNALQKMIDEVGKSAFLLDVDQKKLLAEDRTKFEGVKNLSLNDAKVLSLYGDMQDYFSVQYLYYQENKKISLLSGLQKSVEKTVSDEVTDIQIKERYETMLASQKIQYNSASNYTAALDAANSDTVILARPDHALKQYFVKHILVPFTDDQKNKFLATSADAAVAGLSAAQLKERRTDEASKITGFEHRDGNDYGNPLSIADIRMDIESSVKMAGENATTLDKTFEELIYKYNTDPGAFNNDVGYGLRRDNTEQKFMAEFTKSANGLYDNYIETGKFGNVVEAVTDHGVHFMILSSVMDTGTLGLRDYYNVAQKKTVGEYIKDTIIAERKTERYNIFKSVEQNNMKQVLSTKLSRNDKVIDQLITEAMTEG